MNRILTFLIASVIAMLATGCVSKSATQTILQLDQAKAQTYADVSTSFRRFTLAVEEAAPAGSTTAQKMQETRVYLDRKDAQFERAVRETIRAINAMDWLTEQERTVYMDELFSIIEAVKSKSGS